MSCISIVIIIILMFNYNILIRTYHCDDADSLIFINFLEYLSIGED